MRARAEQEVAGKDGHQVHASCPGVTQCIPPFVGILLPLLGGSFPSSREQTPCLLSFPPCLLWDYKAPFSIMASIPQCSTDPQKSQTC